MTQERGQNGWSSTPVLRSLAGRCETAHTASAEIAHLSCALVHLGEIAYRVGRVLRFDPAAETVLEDREANALLTKEYRASWAPG